MLIFNNTVLDFFQNFLIQGDKDGDSQLSLEEFLDLMHKLAGTSKK